MTNSEKFKEVFGFTPSIEVRSGECIIPVSVCKDQIKCKNCPFDNWWDEEYKECFELKEEYEQ